MQWNDKFINGEVRFLTSRITLNLYDRIEKFVLLQSYIMVYNF